MKLRFFDLADQLFKLLDGNEILLLALEGEESDFIRFNQSKVRQAGSVKQAMLKLELIDGERHTVSHIMLGDAASDRDRTKQQLQRLRENLPYLPDDPYILYNKTPQNSDVDESIEMPDPSAIMDEVVKAGSGLDLVGIYAGGKIYRGFANSLGQRNWFAQTSYNLNWSLYHSADKAVKQSQAGIRWDSEQFAGKVELGRLQLEAFKHPIKVLKPGDYRAYLSPAAVHEMINFLNYSAFSVKRHKTHTTPLLAMITDGRELAPFFSATECTVRGSGPHFQGQGFLRSDQVPLIKNGKIAGTLISPRSAREYGMETNGASECEIPEAILIHGGELNEADILKTLDTGLYVSNLWYVNCSDHSRARFTGMTRFATVWVEGGKIVAPVSVMRFDDTLYRMFGSELEGLTSEPELILSDETYYQRSTECSWMPGALLNSFRLTL
jgi:predicted Zn-dependent protease